MRIQAKSFFYIKNLSDTVMKQQIERSSKFFCSDERILVFTFFCNIYLCGFSLLCIPISAGITKTNQHTLSYAKFTSMLWLSQIWMNGNSSI